MVRQDVGTGTQNWPECICALERSCKLSHLRAVRRGHHATNCSNINKYFSMYHCHYKCCGVDDHLTWQYSKAVYTITAQMLMWVCTYEVLWHPRQVSRDDSVQHSHFSNHDWVHIETRNYPVFLGMVI